MGAWLLEGGINCLKCCTCTSLKIGQEPLGDSDPYASGKVI